MVYGMGEEPFRFRSMTGGFERFDDGIALVGR